MKEIRSEARKLTKGSCRVCPQCDGRACAGEVPGMGGTGTGVSFLNNVAALAEVNLNTRLVHHVHFPKTETELLGIKLKAPLMVAPIGGIAFNLSGAMTEADYQEAITHGAVDAGIIAGTPDAVPMEVMEIGLAKAKALGPGTTMPFIKPWEPDRIKKELAMCAEAGATVVCCDLDSVGLITLRLMGSPAYPKTTPELADIIKAAHQLKLAFLIKGVMNLADAEECLAAGADGLVISNHGGRVLDGVPGVAKVLPKIAAKLKGRTKLIADGGIRSGVDILKTLALGADAVMIGRPFSVAAIGGGRAGVKLYAETLRSQLEQAMIMTGCPDVAEANASLLWKEE
ncbi:MAG: alpha-hydroxy-acid oxidizing protein [Deltaproteobacteria bacterium]|nr:alpha-hydroxy-acid oxidizing protein [Deltaproteobacteria bacterium]